MQAVGGEMQTTHAKRPKNRKAQIALVAAELFCERGYHRVGVDEIAAAVGISGPAVYRHFSNKYAILVHATRELSEAMLATVESDDGGLDEVLAGYARVLVERRRVVGVYQWGRYLTPEHRREFHADLAVMVGRVAGPLRDGRPELTEAQADLLAQSALSVLGSVASHRAAAHRGRTEHLLTRAAWGVLRSPSPSPLPAQRAAPAPEVVAVGLGTRREVLLVEAIRLFHRLSYHAVGMEDVGRAAGINASSVYRHFASKAELLAAAYHRASQRLNASIAAALRGAADPAEALGRLVASYVDFAFGQRDLVAVYLAENNNLPEADRHELRKAQRLYVEEYVRLLGAVRPDLPVSDARVLTHAALSLVTDLGRDERIARSTEFDAEVAQLAAVVLDA